MGTVCFMADAEQFDKTKPAGGNWYGDDTYFGYEYDMHANNNDKDLGAALSVDHLVKMFKIAKPDLLQTDTKGHEGLVSWYSQTPAASVAPGISKEMVKYWSDAAKELDIPIQAHYSGIFDQAAALKFPDWAALQADGTPAAGKMCPRSPYADQLLIPQANELVDRYGIDAMWYDGEIWAVVPCYCDRCKAEFTKRTGIAIAPVSQDDADWTKWIQFTRDSFQEYIAHYVSEIHRHNPKTRVCSNWLHSFRNPGCPWVPTDYVSGDNLGTLSQPNNYCEARFISTRQRPWEIVLWGFYYNEKGPWVMKNTDMMKQQAATIIALGGNINIYNQPKGHRDGRLSDWQMKRIAEVGEFVRGRKEYCQHTETVPNAVILHSEHDLYSRKSPNIWEYNVDHLDGAAFAMIENSIPVDIMDEWALLGRISDFPLVVAPDQANMSKDAVKAVKKYVEEGGTLLVTGTGIYDTLGGEFLGVTDAGIPEHNSYHIPAGDGRFPLSSYGQQGGSWTQVAEVAWRNVIPTTAKGYSPLTTTLFEEDKTPYFAYTVNRVGKGKVAYIPCDITAYYYKTRYPLVRQFFAEVVDTVKPKFEIAVNAPACVEVIFRQKDGKKYIHLINRASGMPEFENIRGTDQIPSVGPVNIAVHTGKKAGVELVCGGGKLKSSYDMFWKSEKIIVDKVQIHSIIRID